MGIAQRQRDLDDWLEENNALSPGKVYLILGRQLQREALIMFEFDDCDGERSDMEVRWEAEEAREQKRTDRPDNPLRFTSKVEKERTGQYFFTHELTEAGNAARACSLLRQACDRHTGQLHKEATVRWWLARSFTQPIDKSERFPWQDEPWAAEVKRALKWTDRGYILVEGTSDPDHDATRYHWRRRFKDDFRQFGAERMRLLRNEWFPRNEPWAELIQEELMVVVLST